MKARIEMEYEYSQKDICDAMLAQHATVYAPPFGYRWRVNWQQWDENAVKIDLEEIPQTSSTTETDTNTDTETAKEE